MAEPITNVLGTVAIKTRGAYDSSTTYEKLNVVTYQGSSYCAKMATQGNLPTNTTYWDLIAEKGSKGETGDDGYTPVKGTDYYTTADKNELEATLASDVTSEVSDQLSTLTSATPLVASSTSGMADTTRIYVNTSDGHWYWYNGEDWQDGGIYQSAGISDSTITPEKTTFFDCSIDGTNLFNINNAVVGLLGNDGELAPTYTDFNSSGFMPVKSGKTYYYSVNGTGASISKWVLYDSNHDVLSYSQNTASVTASADGYLRISIYGAFNAKTQVQADAVTAYIPYRDVTINGVVEEYYKNVFERINDNTADINAIKPDMIYANANPTIQNGYYTGTTFTSNDSYKCFSFTCNEYEKYHLTSYVRGVNNWAAVYFYDENDVSLGNTGILTEDTENNLYFMTPKNCKRIIATGRADHTPNLTLEKLILDTGDKPLLNKKCIFIGDSITAQEPTSWRTTFLEKTGATEELCTAVAGAHLTDYNDTVLNGTDFTGHGNTICNQVQRIINNYGSYDPDIIIIAAGTNDTNITATEFDGNVTQFINSQNEYINVDTVDRTRVDGAMRWQTEKLLNLYPNAIIFYATPIQAAQSIRASWWIMKMGEYMRKVCNYLAIPTIEAGNNSTIYGRYEIPNANGRYLVDGLHPNSDGKVLIGKYYSSTVINYFNF